MYALLHTQPIDDVLACRLCGIRSLDATLNNLLEETWKDLIFALKKHVDIDISSNDSYSKHVCQSCCQVVQDWCTFYSRCHDFQNYLEGNPPVIEATLVSHTDPMNENISNHFSKLVEELVEDECMPSEQPTGALEIKATTATQNINEMSEESEGMNIGPNEDIEDEQCATEDEYEEIEDDSTSDDEEDSHSSEDSPVKVKQKTRTKKFVFDIPFLERKVGRKFSAPEKAKLQKYINKHQNTLVYEMLIGGGPNQLWQCQVCDKTIKGRPGEVTRHYLKTHQVQPIFPCHVCEYSCRTEKMYQSHRMSHLVEYPCDRCDKIFTQHSRLVYHMRSHTNERDFECDVCHKKFNTAQYLANHKRKVHGDQEKLLKYTCELCGMRFKYKNHLQYHQKRHPTEENPLPYSCKYCEEHFMTRAEQLAHSNTVHAGEGDFICHMCGKKMKTILSLENHVKLHSGLKEFKCDTCNAAFATNHSLKCHKKIHEREADQFVCEICSKTMSNKSSLNQHLKTHQATKPHQCPHCNAAFIHKNRLDIHMRKHTGEFPHICIDCGKGFRSTSSMNSHRQYVHSERKFACDVCSKAFKTPRDLKVHSTLHTGEKPNVCADCGKAFRVRANYFKHRKIHTRRAANGAPANEAADQDNEPDEEPLASSDAIAQIESGAPEIGGNDPNLVPVVEAVHPTLVVAATAGDFFQFTNEQQWIT